MVVKLFCDDCEKEVVCSRGLKRLKFSIQDNKSVYGEIITAENKDKLILCDECHSKREIEFDLEIKEILKICEKSRNIVIWKSSANIVEL